MNLKSKFNKLINDSGLRTLVPYKQQKIVVINRSDGLSAVGLPLHIAPWVSDFTNTLYCGDRTNLPIKTSNTLITGTSAHRKEILERQIADAIRRGYTPVVLSSIGKSSEIYRVLNTIFSEKHIHYIANSYNSNYYLPFFGMPQNQIANFFYQLVTTFDSQAMASSMLVKRYIDVCVKVFFTSSEAVKRLTNGQVDHWGLLNELQSLKDNDRITNQEEIEFRNKAESAQAVSVSVLSVFYDFMHKMQYVSASKPLQYPFNCRKIKNTECLFLQVDNTSSGVSNNAPFAQCFQWYLSKIVETEFQCDIELQNQRILLIVDNLSGLQLRWFSWLFDSPNCVLLFNYDDYYSMLTDSSDLRENFAGRMDRIFFFSHINTSSAEWCSRFIGAHTVKKIGTITQAPRRLTDVIFPVQNITENEVEEAWFKKEEIQRLGNGGIVYCKSDNIFKDRSNRRNYVNFCWFGFK